MAKTRRIRARVLKPEPLRFASGWRLLPGPVEIPGGPRPRRRRPSIVFDVIRPADLVALTVHGYGVELVGGRRPHLRPTRDSEAQALLVVHFDWQHLGEFALYEGEAPVPNPDDPSGLPLPGPPPDPNSNHTAPILARPARPSRVVLEVGPGERIEFSSDGILDALGRLSMIVHPLAQPRQGRVRVPGLGTQVLVPGGLLATLNGRQLVLSPARRRDLRRGPDLSTAAGIAEMARNARTLRSVAENGAVVGVRIDERIAGSDDHRLIGGGRIFPDPRIRVTRRVRLSRPARPLETAIEAPFRLTISPSALGGWSHSNTPVGAEDAAHRVEMWHTRLGVRRTDESEVTVDERDHPQRVVRAVWARDRERWPGWENSEPATDELPFRMSLNGTDRHKLVRQSAETWIDDENSSTLRPEPVDADALWLSALGAWLDLHGDWDTKGYSANGIPSILTWDHIAPLGRDQYVRVVYPGYLFPFGHRATLVKVTERKMKVASPSVAGLYQRKFLVVNEPLRTYGGRDLPLKEVRLAPLVTPTLSPDPGSAQDTSFFPFVDGEPFRFVLHALDQEDRKVRLLAPLMWVAEHHKDATAIRSAYTNQVPGAPQVPAHGQDIAFAPVQRGGDTVLPVNEIHFDGFPHSDDETDEAVPLGTSRPFMVRAKAPIPAAEQLAPIGEQDIVYSKIYLDHGFGGAANIGEIWAELENGIAELGFGGSAGAPSDKAGGFLQPSLAIEGLSRAKGLASDLANTATGDFDPTTFLGAGKFADLLPKLFGLVPLSELLSAVGVDLDEAPSVVSEALDRIEGFLSDLEEMRRTAEDGVDDAQQALLTAQANATALIADGRAALAAEIEQKAQDAVALATTVRDSVTAAVDQVIDAVNTLFDADEATVAADLNAPLTVLTQALTTVRNALDGLPPMVSRRLEALADVLDEILATADLLDDLFRFLNGIATSAVQGRVRYEWRPKLANWPSPPDDPIIELPERGLRLAVDGRVGGKGKMSVDVVAELRDFSLNLLPGETLVRFRFDHLMFKSGSTGKAEVDVVMNDIEFVGLLGFVETLKELIPFDGFSDPPYVDVSPSGLEAGFTLALPNVAIGVFSLSNLSLGADVQVPFLGDVVTVGFHFCTRERPFTLAVTFIGGGGWFLIRLSPDGLDVLEVGLEAGATLSIDLGVASGSVSAMLGIYIRLEGDTGSLTAYFRLRGEVDVLGLISASIELYLALEYDFGTGKMIGTATITVKVSVLCFSGTVKITARREFAGSNGDPSFEEIMGVEPDGTSPAWSQYCLAFAGA